MLHLRPDPGPYIRKRISGNASTCSSKPGKIKLPRAGIPAKLEPSGLKHGLLINNFPTDTLCIRFLYHNRAKRINIRCTTLRQDAGRILHILRLILHYHILRIHCGTPHDRIISISIICGIIHKTICITLSG